MRVIEIKLSKTGKMPCSSFSTPATACKTGSKLAKVAGSVCSGCYAMRGNYLYPAVKNAREHNLNLLDDLNGWRDAMIIKIQAENENNYFRWHDSGDIQSPAHLIAIIEIAEALPDIKFWLPTNEKAFLMQVVRTRPIPKNLIIRLSMPLVDMRPASKAWPLTSTVRSTKGEVHGFECNAPKNSGKCGTCRACWDAGISNISYSKH